LEKFCLGHFLGLYNGKSRLQHKLKKSYFSTTLQHHHDEVTRVAVVLFFHLKASNQSCKSGQTLWCRFGQKFAKNFGPNSRPQCGD